MHDMTFAQWLRKHDTHLRSYAPNEIALLALTVGFSIEEVCPGVTDRMSQIRRLLAFWESPLSEQWMNLLSHNQDRAETY